MPETAKKTLHKFLLNLVEQPKALHKLTQDSSGFIDKSALAKTHKKILLGGDAKKIKSLISKAVTGQESAIYIQSRIESEAMHIVFGATDSQVKVSLKPKPSKPGQVHVSAIRIISRARS